jgi:hypothetical protein
MTNHHPVASRNREQQQRSNWTLEMLMLPDDVIVHIGKSVATFCGIQDFVCLSLTCKRFQKLMIDSKETVSEVIRIRTRTSLSDTSGMLMPRPVSIHTLEQLSFYESVTRLNLLADNRICENPNLQEDTRVHFEYADLVIDNAKSNAKSDLFSAVRAILERHPSASVVLDAHSGIPAPEKVALLYSHVRGRVVLEAIMSGENPVVTDERIRKGYSITPNMELQNRISLRAWGKSVSTIVSQSKHPFRSMAIKGRGWIEIYLRMENNDPNMGIVLPPRPKYYNRVARTPGEFPVANSR